MHRLKRKGRWLLFLFMLSPLLGVLYTVVLKGPRTITQFYTFLAFAIGGFYLLQKNIYIIPLFAKFLFAFAVYNLIYRLSVPTNKYFLTEIYYNIQHFAVFFIIVIIYNTNFREKFIVRVILIIKITIVLAALASIIQAINMNFLNANLYLSNANVKYADLYQFRRNSIFGFIDPNSAGLDFLPLLSILIGYMLIKKEKTYPVYLFLGGIVATLTNGRYVIIGFILITFQIFLFYKVRIKVFFKYILILGIGIFFISSVLHSLGYDFQNWYKERLFSEGDITETTRYKAINNFMFFFPKNAIFGVGGMTEEIKKASAAVGSSQIHVGYLSALVYYGVLGSFFLFGFWFLLIKKLYRTAKYTNYWGSFFAFLVFLWANATLVMFHILFYGIIFSLIFDKYYRDKKIFELSLRKRLN